MAISAIFVAPEKGAPMLDIKARDPEKPWDLWKNSIGVMSDGLMGNYHEDVTFFNASHSPCGGALPWEWKHLRRNVIVEGVALTPLVVNHSFFRIGNVMFQATRLLTANDRPTELRELFGEASTAVLPEEAKFSRAWTDDTAGIAARVVEPGQMNIGDTVTIIQATEQAA